MADPVEPHPAPAPLAAPPCILVIFGATGDLTRRLLMPAIYNLACDGLLPAQFAVLGLAADPMNIQQFRAQITADVGRFSTRKTFDEPAWNDLARRLYYMGGKFDPGTTYTNLATALGNLEREHRTEGNVLFYLALPPSLFAPVAERLALTGQANAGRGWRRVIVEKPFGRDLTSAVDLSRALLRHWREEQIFRIDPSLGKDTVQNLLAFRFANEMFEPLWDRKHIDHIQITAAETAGVEGRGRYYENVGAMRDMIQTHMFQMLAYLCMERPSSLELEAVRNETAAVLQAVSVPRPAEARANAVRGQYGPGRKVDGREAVGYLQEPDVAPHSRTETFAALKLTIDNERWRDVPIYLRSGKALWRRGTEIVVQLKKAPENLFRNTPAAERFEPNQIVFHIQPDQEIELRFQARRPGAAMDLQKVHMRFDYREAYAEASATGYEVPLYQAMLGDRTLYPRTDFVESAGRILQPVFDVWTDTPPANFPNYPAGSWGPKEAHELIERDGRSWLEAVNRSVIERVPLFLGCDAIFQRNIAVQLAPAVYAAGDFIIRQGDMGHEMYFLVRGEVEILDGENRINTLSAGSFFGETSLLLSVPRTASVRAIEHCDVLVLAGSDFNRVLRDHPEFAASILNICRKRYKLDVEAGTAFDKQIRLLMEGES